MKKRGKKYRNIVNTYDKNSVYSLEEAVKLVDKLSYTKFPGTIELHIRLKLQKKDDPRSIKGSLSLPHPYKEKVLKIAVAVPVDMKDVAKDAGADVYDLAQIFKELDAGQITFDVLLAVPAVMPELAKYGRLLGPKGLMPNPRTGTVVEPSKLKEMITEFKRGKTVLKTDKTGVLHVGVGKVGMEPEKVIENIRAVFTALQSIIGKSKEAFSKTVHIAPTMGPSIKINLKTI